MTPRAPFLLAAVLSAVAVAVAVAVAAPPPTAPLFRSELIFPLEPWHNHSSSIVELPNGDLMVAWFHGSGEREADDTVIRAARWIKATGKWTAPFLLADTPSFPDTNCVLYVDSHQRLWLFWPAILANTWESALMRYKRSVDYLQPDGPPKWEDAGNILLIPKRLEEKTREVFGPIAAAPGPYQQHAQAVIARSQDKLSSRLGWFTRTHPLELPGGRMLLPMYSDGFSFALVAISDDAGATWYASEPIVGYGNIQPSIVRHTDGRLTAYMRDNGPPPKRIHIAHSSDNGLSWTHAEDTGLPNPGSSVEALALRGGGPWLLVYNDTEEGRNSLAVSMSDDEGRTWKWTRHIERDPSAPHPSQFHYPSLIQARDGTLHLTYSYFVNREEPGRPRGKAIQHVQFNVEWVRQGDPATTDIPHPERAGAR